MKTNPLLFSIALGAVLVLGTANAQKTTTGANWGNATWTPAGTPTSADDVLISGSSVTVNATTSAVANNVAVDTARTLTSAGSLTLNGTLTLGNSTAGTFATSGTGSLTATGIVMSPGVGTSTLTLGGTGAITLGGGTGTISKGGGAGASTLQINGNVGTIGLSSANVSSLQIGINASNGTLTIGSGQSYTATTETNVGRSATFAVGSALLNINGNLTTPTFRVNQSVTGIAILTSSTVNLNTGGTLTATTIQRNSDGTGQIFNWNGGTIANTAGANLTLNNLGSGNSTINLLISLAGTGTHAFNATSGQSITVNSSVTLQDKVGENGTYDKSGAGTLNILGAHTYTGATSVTAGVMNIRNNTALGTTDAGTSVTSGAALELQNNITVGAEALTLNGTGVSGGGALRNISGSNTYGGLLTLGGATRINSDSGSLNLSNTGTITGSGFGLTVGGVGDTTIAGIIGTATGTLVKDGAGTLTLSGANTYTGTTTVNNGTLRYGVSSAISSTSNVSVNANAAGTTATLDLNGFSGSIGTLTLGGTGGTSTSVNQVTTGAGTLTLGGTVSVSSAGNPTTSALISGNVNVGAGLRVFNVLDSSGVDVDLNVNAILSGSGISKAGSGTMLLSQVNTLSGANQITQGTLRFGVDNALNSSGSFTLRGGQTSTLDLNGFNGTIGALQMGGLSGTSASVNQITTGVGTLTIGGNVTYDATGNPTASAAISGNVNLGGANRTFNVADSTGTTAELDVSAVVSSGGITKSGDGTLVLSGANSYLGTTTVNAGTLLVNGSTDASSAVTVTGGTLGGSGTVNGSVTIQSGGTLAPGSSIQSLASGALTLNSGSTFGYELDSSALLPVAADLQVVSGTLDLNGIVTLTLTNLSVGTFANTTKFTLINYDGAWNGGLFTYNSNLLADGSTFSFNGQDWEIDYNATVGGNNFSGEYLPSSNFVNITAVPEPTTWILAALGLTTTVVFRRRRNNG